MHDVSSPHCSYCRHFESCFQIDSTVEWGYCTRKKVPPPGELEMLKSRAETGDYRDWLPRAQQLGLFVPTSTDCKEFSDLYPF